MINIGVFGGSFDPVHLGHTGLAKDAIDQADLDKVIMVPAGIQPFKQDKKTASGEDRYNMLLLATEDNPKIEVSRVELDHEGVSYTYLTLRRFQEEYGEGAKIHFILGTDSFIKLDTWSEGEELLKNYAYIIGSRPGYRQDELLAKMEEYRKLYGTEAINIKNNQLDISATEIRERICRRESVEGMISKPVERYIVENELYL